MGFGVGKKVAVATLMVCFLIMSVSVITKGFRKQKTGPIRSNLPIMVIRMDSDTLIDVDTLEDEAVGILDIIDNENGINEFPYPYDPSIATQQYFVGIKPRGQSTKTCAKKPYGMKILDPAQLPDQKKLEVSMFGWPEQAKFALYSSCVEGSLMRNNLAFEMARAQGNYVVRTKYVELYIAPTNSTDVLYPAHYHGVYILMERIHRGDDFVDVKKMTVNDDSGKAVTGGYLFKVDKENLEELSDFYFFTPNAPMYVMIYPEDEAVTKNKTNYLVNYVNRFENAIMSPNFTYNGEYYTSLIDVASWVDMMLMQEVTKNIDAYRLSTYFYKDRNEKVFAGPVWDLDRTWGMQEGINQIDGFMFQMQNKTNNGDLRGIPLYWPRLIENPEYKAALKARYTSLRAKEWSTPNILTMSDAMENLLAATGAPEREYNRWGPFYYPMMFWTTEPYWERQVRLMREWLTDRLDWMDQAIPAL